MNDFILKYQMKDLSFIPKVIKYFEESTYKKEGEVGDGVIDYATKKSTDVGVNPNHAWNNPVFKSYLEQLQIACNKYKKKYVHCDAYSAWNVKENFNIQHYKPKEGFYKWHAERTSDIHPMSARHLVFMTYLNDVTDGGETEFYYQKLKVQPKKGLTLIWPADWTHTHRGITSKTQEKYIITGWYNYYE